MATGEKGNIGIKQGGGDESPGSSSNGNTTPISDEEKHGSKKRSLSDSTSLSPMHEAEVSVDRDSETYDMNHARRGKALIFNHKSFDDSELRREGTDQDKEELKSTLEGLGFEVVVLTDLTVKETKEAIKNAAKEDHSDADCIIVILMTHGDQGYVFAKDDPYKPEQLWKKFNSKNCGTLAGKPKLFFIQACQGNEVDPGITVKRSSGNNYPDTHFNLPDTLNYTIPIHADFLLAFSSMPGFVSYRNTERGTWFIQSFCKIMKKYGDTDDLLSNMTRLARMVAIDYPECIQLEDRLQTFDSSLERLKQIPCITSMLTRKVIFTKKN